MSIKLDRRRAPRRLRLGALAAVAAGLASCGGSNFYQYNAPAAVVTADFANTGHPGIAVALAQINQLNTGESPGIVSVGLQNESNLGTFQGFGPFSTQGNPSAMTVGALTPGTHDLVVANVNDGTVSVLMQTASGAHFAPQQELSIAAPGVVPSGIGRGTTTAVMPEDVAICDVNGDGHPDIVVAYKLEVTVTGFVTPEGGGVVYLEQNPSNPGTFLPAQLIGSAPQDSSAMYPNSAYGIACGSLSSNPSAPPDIVITSTYQYDQSGDYGTVTIFPNNPAAPGTFGTPINISVHGELHRVVIADVNNDGLPDILVADESPDSSGAGQSGIRLLIQQTPASGATTPTFTTPAGVIGANFSATSLAVGDLNGDGVPDIVSTSTGGFGLGASGVGTINVFLNSSSSPGTFPATPTHSYLALGNPEGIAVAPLGPNALLDIAVADGGGGAVLMNQPSNPGTFNPEVLVIQ